MLQILLFPLRRFYALFRDSLYWHTGEGGRGKAHFPSKLVYKARGAFSSSFNPPGKRKLRQGCYEYSQYSAYTLLNFSYPFLSRIILSLLPPSPCTSRLTLRNTPVTSRTPLISIFSILFSCVSILLIIIKK